MIQQALTRLLVGPHQLQDMPGLQVQLDQLQELRAQRKDVAGFGQGHVSVDATCQLDHNKATQSGYIRLKHFIFIFFCNGLCN
jgi:hypothetical protein